MRSPAPARLAILAAVGLTFIVAASGPAHAQGMADGTFDPTAPSDHYEALLHTPLYGPNAMQSFAFEEQGRNIYVLQTVHGDGPKHDGDMWVNRIDYGGKLLDHMRLDGFGHGAAMGLTRAGSQVSLWVESESRPNSDGEGFGTRVARVIYKAGATVKSGSSAAVDVTPPQAAGKSPRASIDPVTGNLIVRYGIKSGTYGFLSLPTADALAHRWGGVKLLGTTPSAGVARPSGDGSVTSQGYALAGTTAYLYYGDSYKHVAKPGDTYIRAVPLNPAKAVSGRIGYSYSLKDLDFREPEGIAVQVNGGRPRLVFGFAEEPPGGGTQRLANFSYKEKFTPAPVPVPAPAPPPPAPPAPAPVPPPPPAAAPQLVVHPRTISRSSLLRTRRIRIAVRGLDARATVRVTARLRGRFVRVYGGTLPVRVAARTVTLRLSAPHVRQLARSRGRTRLTITVTAGGLTRRVVAHVPRARARG
jgi:hypothetical protein